MKSVKNKIGALVLIAIFLMGTMGMTSYKHFCSVDGASISYFFPSDRVCDDDMNMAMEDAHDCCESDQAITTSHTQKIDDDCCHDEIHSFKVHDQFNSEASPNQLTFHFVLSTLYKVYHPFLINNKAKNTTVAVNTKPPLPERTLDRLSQLRVWRL